MESNWKKVKRALGRIARLSHRKTSEEGTEDFKSKCTSDEKINNCGRKSKQVVSSSSLSATGFSKVSTGNISSASLPGGRSPSGLRRSTITVPASSKNICAICLASLKPGHGHAIFTAECAHTFHFHCIAASVKHGLKKCPICRAKWKEMPFRSSSRAGGKRETKHIGNFSAPQEPLTFSDDEVEDGDDDAPNRLANGYNSSEKIEAKVVPECPAVVRSSSCDNFAVLIHMKAPRCAGEDRAPIDLVTVLDVSGSMAGTKMALLKSAMAFVIQILTPADRLSVVYFSSTSRRVLPLRRMTQTGKEDALRAVSSLRCSGGTNISDGLMKGAKVITDRKWKTRIACILLLSDGRDTHRSTSPRFLPEYCAPVHAFGFGSDHDADVMHSISDTSGGTFSFVEAETAIQDAFAMCVGGLLSVVLQELRVEVSVSHPTLRLSSIKAGSYRATLRDERTGCVDVGDLYAEEERDILVTLRVPAAEFCGTMELLKVEFSYKDPLSKEKICCEGDEVDIDRPEEMEDKICVSVEVDRQRNRFLATEAMAVARREAEMGKMDDARLILERCLTKLRESAAFRGGDKLCASLCEEMKEMVERMMTRQAYEESGRAYVLSGLISHSSQRATARGDFRESNGVSTNYQTPSMVDMISRSQAFADKSSAAMLRQMYSRRVSS